MVVPVTTRAPVSVSAPPALMVRLAALVVPRLSVVPAFRASAPVTLALASVRLLASLSVALPANRLTVSMKSLPALLSVTVWPVALRLVVPLIRTTPSSLTAPPALRLKLPPTVTVCAALTASITAPLALRLR